MSEIGYADHCHWMFYMTISSAKYLRRAILHSLRKQGYTINDGVIQMPENPSKVFFRDLNEMAVNKKLEDAYPHINRYENELIKYIAYGKEVELSKINPKIVCVESGSRDELLFRYLSLHWSIPVSAGYGRRIRFLIYDENNGKIIGLLGLGDPVYSLQARDKMIGFDSEAKSKRLWHVMDAYVLGSVPPYSFLMGGKLVALLACSNEIRNVFRKKYYGRKSIIKNEIRKPFLAMLTTTSALGRSSIYNRIRINGHKYWTSVGFTQGSGEFHFSNGIYEKIHEYVKGNCEPTAKHESWGTGFRNKREVIKKCLADIGLSTNLIYHGIPREIFVAPLGVDSYRFLRGEVSRPRFFDWPAKYLFELFSERWLFGRADRMPQYRDFDRNDYRLWDNPE